jgi:hypothetical protein
MISGASFSAKIVDKPHQLGGVCFWALLLEPRSGDWDLFCSGSRAIVLKFLAGGSEPATAANHILAWSVEVRSSFMDGAMARVRTV